MFGEKPTYIRYIRPGSPSAELSDPGGSIGVDPFVRNVSLDAGEGTNQQAVSIPPEGVLPHLYKSSPILQKIFKNSDVRGLRVKRPPPNPLNNQLFSGRKPRSACGTAVVEIRSDLPD